MSLYKYVHVYTCVYTNIDTCGYIRIGTYVYTNIYTHPDTHFLALSAERTLEATTPQ